jgi:hypothetical protein
MSFQYDPNQQPQFSQENGGNGMQNQGPPPQQQGMQQPQQMQQQPGQEGGSPAPFAQQGGVEGSSGSASGDAKTTLWYVHPLYLLYPRPPIILPLHRAPSTVELARSPCLCCLLVVVTFYLWLDFDSWPQITPFRHTTPPSFLAPCSHHHSYLPPLHSSSCLPRLGEIAIVGPGILTVIFSRLTPFNTLQPQSYYLDHFQFAPAPLLLSTAISLQLYLASRSLVFLHCYCVMAFTQWVSDLPDMVGLACNTIFAYFPHSSSTNTSSP